MGTAVGIDLGTTFSALALVGEDGQARAVPNAENAYTTPSVAIWYQNSFLVGQPALDLVQRAQRAQGDERARYSAALIRGVKRMMGTSLAHDLYSNGRRTTPIEVSAAILAKLAHDASRHLGFPVKDVVITVPAHFGDKERSATRDAAQMAGLRVLQMINEPSAAALTYTHGQAVQPGTALVFDLGGGTFDATVLRLSEQEAKVLATKGIEELGGINFTNTLAGALKRRYEAETNVPYPNDSISNDQLIVVAEAAKCQLSQETVTVVRLAPAQGPTVTIEITRQFFEGLIRLLIFQLQIAVEQAVERAGKTPAQIDRVLLCGGSARIPAVQNMLARFFGRAPEAALNLDLSVALGAAYQAAAYKEDPTTHMPALQTLDEGGLLLIEDCVTYPVGIAVRNARGEAVKLVMLNPGDPLDTWSRAFPVRILGTAASFPPIDVYSGEGTQLNARDYLGSIALALPPGTPDGARGTVMLRQDQSGMVQVQIHIEGENIPGILRRA